MGITTRSRPAAGAKNGESKPTKANASNQKETRKRQAKVIDKMLEMFEEKVVAKDLKTTLSDFIRLLQLQKELEEEQPREITVTWIEPEAEHLSEN
jgi:hypothetical protein